MGKFYVDENNQARIVCHKCRINKNLERCSTGAPKISRGYR